MKTLTAVLALAAALAAARAAAQVRRAEDPAKKLFAAKCAACHGKDGKGSAAMAKMLKIKTEELDLTAEAHRKKSDADLTKIVNEGRNKMPLFKGKLKDAEISSLIAFVRSTAHAPEAGKK